MSRINYRYVSVLLLLVVVVLLGFIWRLGWRCFEERAEARALCNGIADYDITRRQLTTLSTDDAIFFLRTYTHPGREFQSAQLGIIAKRENDRIVQDIIDALRGKTQDDLGNDPEAWIKKYSGTARPPGGRESGGTTNRIGVRQ